MVREVHVKRRRSFWVFFVFCIQSEQVPQGAVASEGLEPLGFMTCSDIGGPKTPFVYFEDNSSELTARAKEILTDLSQSWERHGGEILLWPGFGAGPSSTVTEELVSARTEEVKHFLVSQGVFEQKVWTKLQGPFDKEPDRDYPPFNRVYVNLDMSLAACFQNQASLGSTWILDNCFGDKPDNQQVCKIVVQKLRGVFR